MFKKWNLDIIISYLLYLYPFFLILGPAINNLFHLIIILFSILIFLKKFFINFCTKKDNKNIIFLILLLSFINLIK